MYLTRMHLNPARRGTRRLVGSPQQLHAAVMCAFPPGTPLEDGGGGRVLWRLDRGAHASLTLFVSSPGRPELTHLAEQAGWPASSSTWETVDTTAFTERLTTDQQWAFRLTANPVRSERPADGGRGKVHGHVTVDQQEQWLRSRAGGWGFEVVGADVVRREQLSFRRGQGTVTLNVATFDGVLQVRDPALLRSSLAAGLGRAKGYGCGLLTLAPPR